MNSTVSTLNVPQAAIALDMRPTMLRLVRKQHVWFSCLQGWTVRAVGGALWITQDGDRRDLILEPGDMLQIERDAPVVIGAFNDADVGFSRTVPVPTVRPTHPARTLQRLLAPLPSISALFA